jgi:hypothetical protein
MVQQRGRQYSACWLHHLVIRPLIREIFLQLRPYAIIHVTGRFVTRWEILLIRAWREVGNRVDSGHRQGLLSKKGYEEVTKDLLPGVEYAMLEPRRNVNLGPIVTGLGVDNFARPMKPTSRHRLLTSGAWLRASGAVQQDVKTKIKVRDLIKASKTVDEAKGHVLDAVLDKVRGLMVDEVDPRVSFTSYGLG